MQNIKLKQETAVGSRIVPAERVVDGILVNPEAPPGDADHFDRDIEELLTWWRLPFIVSRNEKYNVRVLSGGAHDRTLLIGSYDTVEEAAEAAKAYYDDARVVLVSE